MLLYYWKVTPVLFIFLTFYPIGLTGAVNFTQCLTEVINCAQNASGANCSSTLNISSATAFSILRTSTGTSVSTTDQATSLSYVGCTTYCGTGPESLTWTVFAQEVSAWLLPYLALLSQLPFGARRRIDNLMSAILTLGSPTLAGYSLFMTLLNTRWVNDKLFSGIDYPSAAVRQSVVQVLSGLQQVPIRVHPRESGQFEPLVVHPDNDDWWITFAEELDYTHTWSISSATSIAWVVIAYLLTVADSISNVPVDLESSGEGSGSEWLWLLPIVVGWLVLSPKCDHDRVHDAYHKASDRAFVANSRNPNTAPTHVASEFGLIIHDRVTSPDELRTPPVFNYARIFSWYQNVYVTSLFYRTAWEKSSRRVGVDGERIPGNVRNAVPRESRLGTRNEIIRYCRPDGEHRGDDVLWPRGLFFNIVVASLMSLQLQWGTTGAAILAVWFTPTIGLGCRSLAYLSYATFSTAVWMLLVLSSALGYYAHNLEGEVLDLERAGENTSHSGPSEPMPEADIADEILGPSEAENNIAIPSGEIQAPDSSTRFEEYQTKSRTGPPAITATIKKSRTRRGQTRAIARVADWLRWMGKSLAIVNAISIIANSLLQYGGVYTNCFCDSSVFYYGSSAAFNVINLDPNDVTSAKNVWIGGIALALASCSFFVGSIYLLRDSLPW